jgi:hypothetical protein
MYLIKFKGNNLCLYTAYVSWVFLWLYNVAFFTESQTDCGINNIVNQIPYSHPLILENKWPNL